ncbi:hypothetical protein Ga0100231_019900 [Opitutaceae bacterium TAV4]|nr:hypothetical protein Ga0100231_019900 [Opitutaceae bacterium TAV4]RRK00330.1 hypothetical protein Ga0100230_020670 [Opitutaceae bacterium TAV3]
MKTKLLTLLTFATLTAILAPGCAPPPPPTRAELNAADYGPALPFERCEADIRRHMGMALFYPAVAKFEIGKPYRAWFRDMVPVNPEDPRAGVVFYGWTFPVKVTEKLPNGTTKGYTLEREWKFFFHDTYLTAWLGRNGVWNRI